MSDLKKLESRINAALSRLEAAEAGHLELTKENARLRADLEEQKNQRQSDLEELERLLDQLKPLIEEGENA
ncbi:hypothetical protein LGT41_0014035 [Abyssibius alkaniclasticus]|uniref:hypothetical protein n=1 Tax=Abyssibius alkaniclasticus TaxID=2881234 RepID=UPI002364727F|nr:hypothetical protein [Abyssibius alkaniclasticus]UPH70889.1 hypothetical protein LGT41_0014035 [Abyssibius alkaniclasticus]